MLAKVSIRKGGGTILTGGEVRVRVRGDPVPALGLSGTSFVPISTPGRFSVHFCHTSGGGSVPNFADFARILMQEHALSGAFDVHVLEW